MMAFVCHLMFNAAELVWLFLVY